MITSHRAYCSQSVGRPHILTSTPIHSRCSYEPICNRTKRKYAKWQSNIFVRQWTIYNIVITLLLIATIIYNISEWDITEIQWFYLKQQISIIANELRSKITECIFKVKMESMIEKEFMCTFVVLGKKSAFCGKK